MTLPTPPERALPDRLRRWQAVRVTDLPLELPGHEEQLVGHDLTLGVERRIEVAHLAGVDVLVAGEFKR